MKERIQCVVLNRKYSVKLGKVYFRGSQWTSPGTGTFHNIIYVNDMPDSLNSFCKIFVDDTKVYTAVEGRKDQIKLQKDLLKLNNSKIRLKTQPRFRDGHFEPC